MASPTAKPKATYVIDTYGLRTALTTAQNSVRNAVISAIESGDMLILKPVSSELKENDPPVYQDLQAISFKKYLAIDVAASKAAAALIEAHGGSRLFGTTPPIDRFRALATARLHKLTLITDGKALKECLAIAAKCKLPTGCVGAPASI
ncbi:hypothetical protein [Sphingomonas sp. UYEF23]|uniref:hypothetical protein n=1 Tax=Sphingomonas sp. UYEF23 TaxID=1756408 RepID=UPI00339A52AD